MRHPCAAASVPNRTHAPHRPEPCYHGYMQTWRKLGRDRLVAVAAVAAPPALAVILVPFRATFPNTDAALALLLVVVAVAANGARPGPEQRLLAVAFAD